MMRVLIVKLTSMGDVIHTLPALTDAARAIPNLKFTWVVDASFAEIAAWHPAVEKVIPIELRNRNLKQVLSSLKQIRAQKFDLIIDAQGLLKSALIARAARGKIRVGYDKNNCREPIASYFYQRSFNISNKLHAITRIRQLFAAAFNYQVPNTTPDYGINWRQHIPETIAPQPYLVFLHGTTWDTKHWPENYWLELAGIIAQQNLQVKLTWATAEQEQRAQRLRNSASNIEKLPHLTINQALAVLYNAHGIVAVDTGFAHLAAALGKPMVAIYGATDINKVGTLGVNTRNLASKFSCAPCERKTCSYTGVRSVNPACLQEINPQLVWQNLSKLIIESSK